jgi:HK97 family phage prohead protease
MTMEFKTIALADAELKFAPDVGAFTGYAAKFGGVDSYGDTIHPGAFAGVAGREAEVKMYFNHGWIKRDLPIGKMTVVEDEFGLRVKSAEFTKGIRMADEAALAVQHKTVNGLSIGYRVKEEKTKKKADGRGRDIYEIDFLKEVSVVDWPADGSALIDVKSSIDEAASLKELESLLRDAAGFSRADATALVSRIKSLSHGEREQSKTSDSLAAIIAATHKLTTR